MDRPTDDQLIDQVAERMKQEGVDPGNVARAMEIVDEVFLAYGRPPRLVSRLLSRFEEFAGHV